MIIRAGISQDLATVRSWLSAARLPSVDLGEAHMADFLIATVDDAPVGIIGLEQFNEAGLLRSLLVDPAARNGGIGRQLVVALEAHAASCDVKELWLLTTDADSYFASLGYKTMERHVAPEAIRATAEFSKLCPGDAALMIKKLG